MHVLSSSMTFLEKKYRKNIKDKQLCFVGKENRLKCDFLEVIAIDLARCTVSSSVVRRAVKTGGLVYSFEKKPEYCKLQCLSKYWT